MTDQKLPIYAVEDELLANLQKHRVIVVQGTTGSGKTTQIPRMILRGLNPRCIAVTQPRRIAAVSVAWRIASEEGVEIGQEVGYGIRFDDQSGPTTRIKVMTDGLILSEARSDPDLSRYDVIMVDEAHERSLNIDVTLGLLYELIARRPDLKVIISSATLKPKEYQRFFKPVAGDVPVINIEAKVFPVDIQYRPPPRQRDRDIAEHIAQGVTSIHREREPGHVLVFLPGEGLIRRTSEAIAELCRDSDLVVLQLFGRLTREEQERVFEDFDGKRKVILATNVAETSITIPGVRYVIDSGLAKVPRYKPRSGITELREEPISLASAKQRAGRAGRTAPGIVWRLYPEASMGERPETTQEEILRLNLDEVVLRLLDLGVPDVERFPFPTRPPKGKLRSALDHLEALGAIDSNQALTRVGRRMAAFPLSPSLARMVIEAAENYGTVVDDVIIVGAFMSGRGPWVLPEGFFDEAKATHAQFHHPLGDACTLLGLYRAWEKSGHSEFFCQDNFVDVEVLRFARKAHDQICEVAEKQGIELKRGGALEDVVKALATGLADKVLRRDGYAYETISGARVGLHPSCSLVSDPPDFVVAAELVAFARPYAMNVSALKPSWVTEISPLAARAFGIKHSARPEKTKAVTITEVRLGDKVFEVIHTRGKASIDVFLEDVDALKRCEPTNLSPEEKKVRARVVWTDKHSFATQRLGKFLNALRRSPFPPPGSKPPKNLRLGDLQDVNLGRHHIESNLILMLQPGVQGKTAGWIALVANGAGGYWLDVITDYRDAIKTSAVSLGELQSELYQGDELLERAERLQRECETLLEEMI